MTGLEYGLVGLGAVAGGAVNALAGGGTLITFPLLVALGIPAVAANVTNTVALCPGYLGGTFAQLNDLHGNKKRLWILAPAGVLGGIAGGVLLLNTSEQLFSSMVPYLILLAAGLLAVQEPLRAWIVRRGGHSRSARAKRSADLSTGSSGRRLRGVFRRRFERDHPGGAWTRNRRLPHAVKCAQTAYLL